MSYMVSNIKNIAEIFSCLYCLAELFGKKIKINIYLVVLVILDMFLMTGINTHEFPRYFSSLVYIAMFLYGLFCYGESAKTTFVNCLLALAVATFVQVLCFLPLYYLFFTKYRQGILNELLINVGCLLLIIISSHKIKLKKLSDFIIKRNKLIVSVSVVLLCIFAFNFYRMKDNSRITSEGYIQLIYFLCIFLFVIYEWQKSRMDVEKKKTQLEMNRLYFDAYDQLILLVRQRQHDMKTHISTIRSMIFTTDNYDELIAKQKEYCDYVMDQNENTRLVLSVENPLIAGFLYSKIQEADNKGIEVEYHVNMRKESLIIPEYDLIEMGSILLDNAIDALCNSPMDTDEKEACRKICITIKETDESIALIVANTSDYYEDDMTERFLENGYSSKGKGRGIGLSKLRRIVHDRKGDIIVSNELYDYKNYLTFTINLPKDKNKKM